VTGSVVLPPMIGAIFMPPSEQPVPDVQFSSQFSLFRAIVASFLLWLLLAWCIRQVFVALF
jgi:hypothetical protein